MPTPTIDEITLADDPDRWAALGFSLTGGALRIGAVRLRFLPPAPGKAIAGWSLREIAATELDGLPTTRSRAPLPAGEAPAHANGTLAIDHVVAMTPALQRTVEALQKAGLDLRRIREEPTAAGAPRQAFFRLGAEILEVVQEPQEVVARSGGPGGPARFWGLALCVADLDASVAALGVHAGTIRAAVQPGRRIATVRRSAGLAVPLALMSVPERGERAA